MDIPQFVRFFFEQLVFSWNVAQLLTNGATGERFKWVDTYSVPSPQRTEVWWKELIVQAHGDWGYAWTPAFWSVAKIYLRQIQQLLPTQTKLFVAVMPISLQLELPANYSNLFYPQEQAEALMAELGITYLNPIPFMRQQGGERLIYDQCHLTERGHQVVGEFLFRAFRDYLSERKEK